ncbi:MAG: nitroreductase family protein [Oscillospiraceae bacterium]|jgi:nitroreductase|nr:nitroreductase family protein [Oscillospiraceae bacterium]
MNEIFKAITQRYSCRDFKEAPLSEGQISALVEAALSSPSAMNRQPWQVIFVTDKKLIEDLDAEGMNILAAAEDKTMYERVMSRGGKLLYNAPCMVIVTIDGNDYSAIDCGILCQNVALAALSLGLASCIVGMARIPLSGPRGEDFKKRLKFPEGHAFGIGILIGEPNSSKEPHELDMSKVTFIG